MKIGRLFLLAILSFSAFSEVQQNFNFSEADHLFSLREKSIENTQAAMDIYEQALRISSGAEYEYALQQFAWASYYKGDILTNTDDKEERKAIFSNCLNYVKALEDSQSVTYYTWKLSCLAMWAEASAPSNAISRMGELKNAVIQGLAKANQQKSTYFKGGIYRVAAALYTFEPQLILFGLYRPDLAIKYADKSIEIAPDIYMAYTVKAFALNKQGKTDEARDLLNNKIQELEEAIKNNWLDPWYGPENKHELQRMKGVLSSFSEEDTIR